MEQIHRVFTLCRYRLSAAVHLIVLFAKAKQLLRAGGRVDASAKRTHHYFFGTMFLGAVFGQIRGRALGTAEMKRFANLAALAGYFDDLAEATPPPLGPESGAGLETYGRLADPSGLVLRLLNQAYADVPALHAAVFHKHLLQVFHIETQGRQQKLPPPGDEEIRRLTAEKGGCSVLLFRCLLADALSAAEQRALFEFGHLVQVCDDIFDLWHDRQAGTATLATVCAEQGDLAGLEAYFEQQAIRVGHAVRQVNIPSERRETAFQTVFFLMAVTRVCLRHYRCLQKKHGTLPLEDRRRMVVDMARLKLRFRVVAELFAHRASLKSTP